MKKLDEFNKIVDSISPNQPLTGEGMEILMNILLDKTDKFNEIISSKHELAQSAPQLNIFVVRIEVLTSLKLTLGALIMIAHNIESFGNAVMYAYYLHRKCIPNILTVEYLSEHIFPMGMISKEQHKKMWKAQKINNDEMIGQKKVGLAYDNLLDYIITWEKE